MARRKRRKNPLEYVALPKIDLDPDTKRGIFIVLILAIGMISLLSLFGLAGEIGIFLSKGIVFLFGWGRWIVPIIFLVGGFVLYNEDKYYIRGSGYLGFFLFFISLETILHLFVPQYNWEAIISSGGGGGYFGFFLASIFVKLLGFWAGSISVACLLLISLMLSLNAPLTRLVGRESWFAYLLHPINFIFGHIFRGRNNNEEDEEEDVDDEEVEEEIEEDEENDIAGEEDDDVAEPGFATKAIDDLPEFMKIKPKKNVVKEEKENAWKSDHVKIDLPLDLLNGKVGKPMSGDIKNSMIVIQRTLENFGIAVDMGDVSVGPTVTQYTFKPAEGVKLSKITNLGNDLALSLAAHPIRIEAPIPGKSLVGVEVPNQSKAIVGLKEILSDKDFKDRKSNLMIALGKDVSGKAWLYDLAKMPHLLVAGATNSGKSVCLNSIIVSLLYQNNPDDLRFIMVDPKRVELPVYNNIPHLLTPVITDVPKTINALKWCLNEMDRRFELLSKNGKRNIGSYNETAKEKMPYLVFVIDELADLMVAAAKDIEGAIIRLAQMSRAVGIHLILATQRPSVDVITGLIKANMPARIAFSVASGTDSRTILDSLGAEKLLGQGDMLFVTAELSKPKRLQGAYLSDLEIKKITRYIKDNGGEVNYIEGITDRQKVKGVAGVGMDGGNDDDDELLSEARELIINSDKASASFLQRRLSVGYARAARLLDLLEDAGVIGPSNGAKPREILISKEQYANMISQGVSGVSLHNSAESEAPDEYLGGDDDDASATLSTGEEEDGVDDDTEEDDASAMLSTSEDEDALATLSTSEEEDASATLSTSEDEDFGKYFSK